MRPGIDLIVVDYRSPHDLQHFLHSVLKYPPAVPWTLTIVNVEPTEEDIRVAKSFPTPVNYIEFEENVGYARAVNRAATLGSSETLVAFNADTRLTEDVITVCHKVLHSNAKWGILGPRQIDNEGRITAGGFFPQERGFHHRNSEQYADIRDDATTVSGSAYFIKRTVWDELTTCPIYREHYPEAEGAFLPTPLYYEETWCSHHATKHGYQSVYYGPATMIHEWNRAARGSAYAKRSLQISRQMFKEACETHNIV